MKVVRNWKKSYAGLFEIRTKSDISPCSIKTKGVTLLSYALCLRCGAEGRIVLKVRCFNKILKCLLFCVRFW